MKKLLATMAVVAMMFGAAGIAFADEEQEGQITITGFRSDHTDRFTEGGSLPRCPWEDWDRWLPPQEVDTEPGLGDKLFPPRG